MIHLRRCGAKLRKKICLKTQTNVRLPQDGAAVMYLGVPATSASAERLFRIAGRTYDDLRQGMKEQMLEVLMWARIKIVRSASARAPHELTRWRCGSRVVFTVSRCTVKQYT